MASQGNCVTDKQYKESAKAQASAIRRKAEADAAIYTALALYQRNANSSIANMQYEIADRQTKLAEEVHAHVVKFWPYEKDYVDDAFAETKHSPLYTKALIWGSLSRDSLQAGEKDWRSELQGMCLGASRCMTNRWKRVAQNQRADVMSFAMRQAEAEADVLNDLRYNKQYAALGLGRGILADLKSYNDVSGTLRMSAGEMLTDTINSGAEALGYLLTPRRPDAWGEAAQVAIARAPDPTRQVHTPVQVQPAAVAAPVYRGEVQGDNLGLLVRPPRADRG